MSGAVALAFGVLHMRVVGNRWVAVYHLDGPPGPGGVRAPDVDFELASVAYPLVTLVPGMRERWLELAQALCTAFLKSATGENPEYAEPMPATPFKPGHG